MKPGVEHARLAGVSSVWCEEFVAEMGFYRATACNATHGIAVAILSVRPSVCLSVRPSVRQMRVL